MQKNNEHKIHQKTCHFSLKHTNLYIYIYIFIFMTILVLL